MTRRFHTTKEHGQCVVQQPPTTSTSTSASGAASSSSTPVHAATGKPSRIAAEFQVCDDSGKLEVAQRADGKVYVPDQQYPIGWTEYIKII